ncbi:unnamed protein product [Ambrosiozyma monospora]|uniref:Unnamed protein product n=1 Tax=Ambrosiozyma monospora TaxID=43982 RepID=A0ACB5U2P1_AMBMO|nr:unnamed protein product [Ambrosiozyma monospora]
MRPILKMISLQLCLRVSCFGGLIERRCFDFGSLAIFGSSGSSSSGSSRSSSNGSSGSVAVNAYGSGLKTFILEVVGVENIGLDEFGLIGKAPTRRRGHGRSVSVGVIPTSTLSTVGNAGHHHQGQGHSRSSSVGVINTKISKSVHQGHTRSSSVGTATLSTTGLGSVHQGSVSGIGGVKLLLPEIPTTLNKCIIRAKLPWYQLSVGGVAFEKLPLSVTSKIFEEVLVD